MSITVLPNGRLRVQVYDPNTGKSVSAAKVLDLPRGAGSWPNTKVGRREAAKAREAARDKLYARAPGQITLKAWADRWTTDPLFARPKDSTNIINAERIKRFVDQYGHLPLDQIGDQQVSEWIWGGKNLTTIPSLKTMFNDAMSVNAGRLIKWNPFVGVKLPKRTRKNEQPPTLDKVWEMIRAAHTISYPGFAAWLQVACFTGMRPGELDALTWDAVDFNASRIHVRQQYSATSGKFTSPKNGQTRLAILTPPARDALVKLPRYGSFVFTNMQGNHLTASARAYHWKAVKAAAGWDKTLYLATRHFAGYYMRNVLRMDSEDTGVALGHLDGGQLVRDVYGHFDQQAALSRVFDAFEQADSQPHLRLVEGSA